MNKLPILLIITLFLSSIAYSQDKQGLLVLAHGGSPEWNQLIENAVTTIRDKHPVSIAYGMALPRTIENGVRELEEQGVTNITVVPLFISSHSFIIRQSEYFLGLRDQLADPLLIMDHSGGGHKPSNHTNKDTKGHSMDHSIHGMNHKQEVPPQISSTANIRMIPALDDHALVAEILKKRIFDLSSDPENETVIIVGHGPNPEDDNRKWVAAMESLARQIRMDKEGKNFKNIFSMTVRDDSKPEIYEMAKENLRSIVRQASQNSTVLVVPLLLSKGGIEKGIVERLEGLDYEWKGETLLPDPLISRYILEALQSKSNSNKMD